jgi:hypothetical protein
MTVAFSVVSNFEATKSRFTSANVLNIPRHLDLCYDVRQRRKSLTRSCKIPPCRVPSRYGAHSWASFLIRATTTRASGLPS